MGICGSTLEATELPSSAVAGLLKLLTYTIQIVGKFFFFFRALQKGDIELVDTLSLSVISERYLCA